MDKGLLTWQIFHSESHKDPGRERVVHMFLSGCLLIDGSTHLLTRKGDGGDYSFSGGESAGEIIFSCSGL